MSNGISKPEKFELAQGINPDYLLGVLNQRSGAYDVSELSDEFKVFRSSDENDIITDRYPISRIVALELINSPADRTGKAVVADVTELALVAEISPEFEYRDGAVMIRQNMADYSGSARFYPDSGEALSDFYLERLQEIKSS